MTHEAVSAPSRKNIQGARFKWARIPGVGRDATIFHWSLPREPRLPAIIRQTQGTRTVRHMSIGLASAQEIRKFRPLVRRQERCCLLLPGSQAELRVFPGLYWHLITEGAQNGFFDDTRRVANDADRIGYRFKGGRQLEFVPREQPYNAGSNPSNITDACYPYGSIQVPHGTEPIVLKRDADSGGGFLMLGTVVSADMDLIGQLQPNTPTKFVRVDIDAALAARKNRSGILDRIREATA